VEVITHPALDEARKRGECPPTERIFLSVDKRRMGSCPVCNEFVCFNSECIEQGGGSHEEVDVYQERPKRIPGDELLQTALRKDPAEAFAIAWGKWPKQTERDAAVAAWRTLWSPDRIEDREFVRAFVQGVGTWLNYWKDEETEVRYVPKLANWIGKEQWAEMPPKGK
jgi:hypothetical protein